VSGAIAFRRALLVYGGAFVAVAVLARAAIITIGLPDWVFQGALIVMALGLPIILMTAYVQHAAGAGPGHDAGRPRGTAAAWAARASPYLTWPRAARGGASAMGAFIAVIGAFMGLRALGIGPAGSLMGAGKLKAHPALIVADFQVPAADSSLAPVIAEAVRAGLGESAIISVLQPATIAAALGRMQRPANSRLDVALATEVAAREGASAIVDGTVTTLGTAYVVSVRLTSADSGLVLASFRETASGPTQLIPTLDKLARDVRGKIGESLRKVHAAAPLERVTTASTEALRIYAAGAAAADAGDPGKAIPLLRQAATLDTDFAMAWRKLAVALRNAGAANAASSDSAIRRALRNSARLTPRERLLAEGYYYQNAEPDWRKAAAAYDSVLAVTPQDQVALVDLAVVASTQRQFARADTLLERALLNPEPAVQVYGNLWANLVNAGRVAAAESVYRRQIQQYPGLLSDRVNAGAFPYFRGQVDSAAAIVTPLASDPDRATRIAADDMLRLLALVRGHLQEANSRLAMERALDSTGHTTARMLSDSIQVAFQDIWFRGDTARGLARLDAAFKRYAPQGVTTANAAAYYAFAGRAEPARALVQQIETSARDSATRARVAPTLHNTMGRIALAEHRPLDAVKEFRAGDSTVDGPADDCPICLPIELGLAYDEAGMTDSAIANFERFVTTPYANRLRTPGDAAFLAGSYKRLGELYEAKGDAKRAIANYGKFIDLWKDADPELQPKVAEVRRRLARLQRGEPH
ncbi:MAG TPA: tetratricopeptide repeat protein, partial [Gemmatimonadaceae bacterium]|nr:tetratricopeptide repeat protein [Gemmatimonadaceae bacterium]